MSVWLLSFKNSRYLVLTHCFSLFLLHTYTNALTSNRRLCTSLSSLDLQVLSSSNTSLYQSARFDSALPQCVSEEWGISGRKIEECVNVWHRTRSVIHPNGFSALILSRKVSIATLSRLQYIFNPLISIITYGCGVYGRLMYMCGWNRYPLCVCVFRSLKALVTLLETADAAAQTADSFVVACCIS